MNYLDNIQRRSRESTEDNEADGYIAYFIEEAQDCFNSRSTTRLEAEEFLSVFNESRNQKEAFFTASQRLTDFSKTIRTKQVYCIGKIPEEDKSIAIRRLERKYEVDFSKLEPRTWVFEGKLFKSPNWKQHGKPYQINKEVKEQYIVNLKPEVTFPEPEPSLTERIIHWVFGHGKQDKVQTIGVEAEEDYEAQEEDNQLDEDLLLFQEEFED